MSKPALGVGDSVMLSRAFLRNTGQFSGHAPFMQGVILSLQDLGGLVIATVDWDAENVRSGLGGSYQSRVNVKNLVASNRRHLEPV